MELIFLGIDSLGAFIVDASFITIQSNLAFEISLIEESISNNNFDKDSQSLKTGIKITNLFVYFLSCIFL